MTNAITNEHFMNEWAIIRSLFYNKPKVQMFVVTAGWFVAKLAQLEYDLYKETWASNELVIIGPLYYVYKKYVSSYKYVIYFSTRDDG